MICEDWWFPAVSETLSETGAEILIAINGSPFEAEKHQARLDLAVSRCVETGLGFVFVNQVGGQDELVFEGASFVMNADRSLAHVMPMFTEGLRITEWRRDGGVLVCAAGEIAPALPRLEQIYGAMVLGLRDYVNKNRFPGVVLGLSGGIDSAISAAVAVDALGADRVRAVMMPSPYTAEISWIDARELAKNLGVQYDEIPISQPVDAIENVLRNQFANLKPDATEENIQARVRGTLLMALSNKTGRLVLTTGNKSEMAVGYCTLYGDMAGGFAVIKDIAKTLVYKLCHYRNQIQEIIPKRILTRAPSAELRPNQTDQDSLPAYEVLDAILMRYMEQNQSSAEIIAAGYEAEAVSKVTRLIQLNEYKRRQSPPGVRITARAFGRDWRYPITSGAKL